MPHNFYKLVFLIIMHKRTAILIVTFREKKCVLYTGKYGMTSSLSLLLGFTNK